MSMRDTIIAVQEAIENGEMCLQEISQLYGISFEWVELIAKQMFEEQEHRIMDNQYYDELERDHDESYEPEYDDSMDGDFDSAMASAGFGTDEDYGYYGDE